jgi:hypothetical protein
MLHNKFVTKKKTIMICEDEPDVLLSFELMLKSKYNILLVDSGEECMVQLSLMIIELWDCKQARSLNCYNKTLMRLKKN